MKTGTVLSSTTKKGVSNVIVALGILASASASGGVYDDVAYWLRPNDRTGNGYVRSSTGGGITGNYGSDFVNAKTAADGASSVTNRFGVFGPANGIRIANETVRLPMSGDELANVPCLKFVQNEWIDTSVTPWTTNSYPNVMRTRHNVFTNEVDGIFKDINTDYTIVTRLRRDPSSQITLDNEYETRILSFFFSSSKGGVRLCLKPGADDNARELCVMYANGAYSDPVCIMPTNRWTDVAIVSSNAGKTLDVYARVEGEESTNDVGHVTATLKSAYMLAPYRTGYFVIGSGDALGSARKYGVDSGYDNAWVTYFGSVQHLAVWSRALAIDDVREAFAGTQPDLWRAGLADGSAKEFAGESNADSLDVETSSWHLMPQGLDSAHPSYSFGFRARANQAGLAQLFRFTATPQSASGVVSLSVNGTTIEERDIRASGETVFFVPENIIVSGANTLSVTRQDSGSGKLEWDCLALGGSWMLGNADGSYHDFKDKNILTAPYPVRDGLPGIVYGTLSDYTEYTRERSFVFKLSGAVLQRGVRFRYDTHFIGTSMYFSKPVTVSVNGTALSECPSPRYNVSLPYSVKIPGSLLCSGDNTITLSVPALEEGESNHYWTRFDFHRLRVLPPPNGFIITFK